MSYREKTQDEFDLDRVIALFDEALTSNDERVVNALRSLLMIVTLTRSESSEQVIGGRSGGPLSALLNRVGHLEREMRTLKSRVEAALPAGPAGAYRAQSYSNTGMDYSWAGDEIYRGSMAGSLSTQLTSAPIPALTAKDIQSMIDKLDHITGSDEC